MQRSNLDLPMQIRLTFQNFQIAHISGNGDGCACRPSHLEFSVVFSETRVNMGYDALEKTEKCVYDLKVL